MNEKKMWLPEYELSTGAYVLSGSNCLEFRFEYDLEPLAKKAPHLLYENNGPIIDRTTLMFTLTQYTTHYFLPFINKEGKETSLFWENFEKSFLKNKKILFAKIESKDASSDLFKSLKKKNEHFSSIEIHIGWEGVQLEQELLPDGSDLFPVEEERIKKVRGCHEISRYNTRVIYCNLLAIEFYKHNEALKHIFKDFDEVYFIKKLPEKYRHEFRQLQEEPKACVYSTKKSMSELLKTDLNIPIIRKDTTPFVIGNTNLF